MGVPLSSFGHSPLPVNCIIDAITTIKIANPVNIKYVYYIYLKDGL